MADNDFRFSKEEFDSIYSRVPRLTVEVIVKNSEGAIVMTKRDIEPYMGTWHLPGGTVYYGETLREAVQRVAQRELGITVSDAINNGYIEYPSHFKHGIGSPVGIVFEVIDYSGEVTVNKEASEGGWFSTVPENTHPDQDTFLLAKGYLAPTPA